MDKTKQDKKAETPVVSPLANDKTYGERMYTRIFDWGLNYWTNLLASAGFSQWAEHATRPITLPFMDKPLFGGSSPREVQAKLANKISEGFFMKRLYESTAAEKGVAKAVEVVAERSMARARSLTLLTPGFAIMIPAVWLGAKIKPAFVEFFNRRHYGDEAMEDPSLQARHQAIAAEERPTFIGTLLARIGTAAMVQVASQGLGSDNNRLNKFGEKHGIDGLKNIAIDPITEKIGYSLGAAVPSKLQARYNAFAQRHGMSWSNNQLKQGEAKGIYNTASQDLGRFIAADTVYTLITALTIRPLVKLLRFIPGMSYKPKVPENSATFDGEAVKVPANRYLDQSPALADSAPAKEEEAITTPASKPKTTVSDVHERTMMTAQQEQQLA